jgi:hypothetical protein
MATAELRPPVPAEPEVVLVMSMEEAQALALALYWEVPGSKAKAFKDALNGVGLYPPPKDDE